MDISQQHQPPFEVDLLGDKNLWKGSSVVKSVVDYCAKVGANVSGNARFRDLRKGAAAQRLDLSALDVKTALGSADNWLPIIAFGQETHVRVDIVGRNPVEFEFKKANRGDNTGDNTVPFLGAIPPFDLTAAGGAETPRERLVGVVKGDAGFGEYTDLFGAAVGLGFGSLHSFLPRMDAVQAIVFGFLRDTPPKYRAKAHPVPGVTGQNVRWPDKWNLVAVDVAS
jgi:hypothetical protein